MVACRTCMRRCTRRTSVFDLYWLKSCPTSVRSTSVIFFRFAARSCRVPSGPFWSRVASRCLRCASSRSGIASTGSTSSTSPVAAALAGMPLMATWSKPACAMVRPPCSLTVRSPRAPSLPVPDSTMLTAQSPWSSASEVKNVSMGHRYCLGGAGLLTCSTRSWMVRVASGGITYTCPGSTTIPSAASSTGIEVCRPSRSTSMLSCWGARCCTSTKAMSVSAGMRLKNPRKASNPPAEAPMPTISAAVGADGDSDVRVDESASLRLPEATGLVGIWRCRGLDNVGSMRRAAERAHTVASRTARMRGRARSTMRLPVKLSSTWGFPEIDTSRPYRPGARSILSSSVVMTADSSRSSMRPRR